MRNFINFKKIPKTVSIFLLFMFSSLFQLFFLPFFDVNIKNPSPLENLALSFFSDTTLLAILVIIYFDELKKELKKLKNNFNKNIEIGIKAWLIGLGVMMVSNVIIGLLTPATAVNENYIQDMIHSSKLLAIITIGIIGPCIEELVFRKSLKELFKNSTLFILISGLIFGSLHVVLSLSSISDLLYIIPYSSLGIAFAYTYVKTDNIYTSILLHIFHNTVLTILSIYGTGVIIC